MTEYKFKNRFVSFCNSLAALQEARYRDMTDSFVLSGTAAKFSITTDLAWKVMKDILTEVHLVNDFAKGSPKEVLTKAKEVGLIDSDIWLDMVKTRNLLSHDYDSSIIKESCSTIINEYLDVFQAFQNKVEVEILQENDLELDLEERDC